jgi:hypothetical protein
MGLLFRDESLSFETPRAAGAESAHADAGPVGTRQRSVDDGRTTYADFIRRTTAYTLEGIADRVTAPTLTMDAEDDQFLAGQPEMLQRAVTAPTTLARFTTAEGSGEHCHVGSLLRAHQVIFDWLGTIVAAGQRVNAAPPVAPTQEK